MTFADGGSAFASVAVPVPVRRLFTYKVGASLSGTLVRGTRVRVPFGPRKVVGTVVQWPADPPETDREIKPIDSVLGHTRPLSPELLELTRFLSDYYLCSWGEAIEAALPPESGRGVQRRAARRRGGAHPAALPARALARRRLLQALPADGSPRLLSTLGVSERRAIPALVRLGQVELVSEPVTAAAPEPPAAAEPGPTPTPAQAAVLQPLNEAIAAREYRPFLLYGATGSGKTEVYLRAAQDVLDRGRGVLYLVPEIGLTPLLVSHISRRFPGRVALMHSGLTRRQRYEAWRSVHEGRRRLVVGTRSAVFAPIEDL